LLISNEVIRSRAAVLAENITRWGSTNTIVTNNDVTDFGKLTQFFDCILIDAPCSGEGMFRKDKDSIQEWSEENVAICSARQRRILADLLPSLALGGHLIYSTCTYSLAENEEVIQWILTNFPEMELAPIVLPTEYGATPVNIEKTENAAYRCYPHLTQGEGFFVCRLRKKGEKEEGESWELEEMPKHKKAKLDKHTKKPAISIEKQILPFCREQVEANNIEIFDDNVFYFSEAVKNNLPFLKGLHLLKKGTLLGKIQGNELTPSHELAMSEVLASGLLSYELDLATALSYLQKNDLPNESQFTKGWILATYQGCALGWLKAAGNRLKNHFPINWRIRNL
jgi:NOL1/NOP2/fmu family ribosome biogenesis protein